MLGGKRECHSHVHILPAADVAIGEDGGEEYAASEDVPSEACVEVQRALKNCDPRCEASRHRDSSRDEWHPLPLLATRS